jgi:hypothetical protein
MSYDDDFDAEEVRERVRAEVDSLSDSQLRTFRHSQSSLDNWIYRTARAIGRALAAPIRWLVNLIRGFFDGFFS